MSKDDYIMVNKSIYLDNMEELRYLRLFKGSATNKFQTVSNNLMTLLSQEYKPLSTKQHSKVLECIQSLNSFFMVEL